MVVLNTVKDVQELLVKRSAIYSDRYAICYDVPETIVETPCYRPRAVMLNEM
jgi:hypothetical protein